MCADGGGGRTKWRGRVKCSGRKGERERKGTREGDRKGRKVGGREVGREGVPLFPPRWPPWGSTEGGARLRGGLSCAEP